VLNNDTLDDLRTDKENYKGARYGEELIGSDQWYSKNRELNDSQNFDPKKRSGVKKSFQNMKNILQKAKDQAVGIIGKSIDENDEDMHRLRMDSQRLSLN
jgi:hypothetical protein